MRLSSIAFALLLAAPAVAQTTPQPAARAAPAASTPDTLPSTPATPARSTHHRMTQTQRFEHANTTNDGKLTLEQAKAGHMNAVVRDFAAIDKDSKGYVTMADIRTHRRAVRAAHKSAAASKG